MKISEDKLKQFTQLLDGLTEMQFSLLVQQARSFYSSHQHKVQLTDEDLKRIEANCRREFI
ncbi:hypothetical protein IGJ28_000716 [Enterococcus sp. AZ091]|uniref:hypothetical protein n=1 Tax=Enterococcus sp. AZ091 TaxID=2774720 RepID=UPI003F282762